MLSRGRVRFSLAFSSSISSSSVVSWCSVSFHIGCPCSLSCLCSFILMGFAGLSRSSLLGSWIGSTWRETSRVHPRVCRASRCYHFDGWLGVVYAFARFFGLWARVGGASTMSHCATQVQAFFQSTRVAIAVPSEFATIKGQSTRKDSKDAMIKSALFFGMSSGRGCRNPPYSSKTMAISGIERFLLTASGMLCLQLKTPQNIRPQSRWRVF